MTEERGVSPFTAALCQALRAFMDDPKHPITGQAIADRLGRSAGYVSEHTSGRRAPDSDLLDTVAILAGMSTRALVNDLLARMEPQRSASESATS